MKKESSLRPDVFIKEIPLFEYLGPISRVFIGSTNQNKINGAVEFFNQLSYPWGDRVLLPKSQEIYGQEAEWSDARTVVASKIFELISQMKGDDGGRALVMANDVVFSTFRFNKQFNLWMPRAQSNLSRYGDQEGAEQKRQNAFVKDVDFYGNRNGSVVCWDTVVGFSAPPDNDYPGLQVMLANRHLSILRSIPEARIKEVYSRSNLYRQINARLDLVGSERDFIEWYGFIPMKATVNGNGFRSLDHWYDSVYWIHRSDPEFIDWGDMVNKEIINGAPFGIQQRVDQLLSYEPKAINPTKWTEI